MTKNEFILRLQNKLSNFPENEVNDRISFYSEIIDDYIDEGLSESEAVLKLGNVDDICEAIANDIPLSKIAKKKLKNRKQLSTLNSILLILGFPIWLSLLIALVAVLISLYVSLWSIVISLWAIVLSCGVTSFASLVLFIIYLCAGNPGFGFVLLSAAFVLLGISILFMLLSKWLTDFIIKLPKIFFKGIKKLFIVREVNDEENN